MRHVVLSITAAAALLALPALAQTAANNNLNNPTGNSSSTDTTMAAPADTTSAAPADTGSPSSGAYDNSAPANTDTTTTTTTTTNTTPNPDSGYTSGTSRDVNGVPVQEQRTNPAVPTHTEDSGLTATGSVVSWNSSEVVLRTSTGVTHFKILPETVGASTSFAEGQPVSIDFTRNEQGVLIAKQIRPGEATATTTTTETTTAPAETTTSQAGTGTTSDNTAATTGTTTSTSTYSATPSTTDNTASTSTETSTTTGSTSMPNTAGNSPLIALLGLAALGAAAGLRRL